ncbi:MAG: NAD(P)/FAD-dependent oxidoreductase [Ruminococcus sp.]|nr:NAD(P)/FAD-dependent oxidoreductase [Ruminococcus sp.]
MTTDHLCIGGGPAGVFAALTAARSGNSCVILEQNEFIGRKLRITGKGRCNLTNDCDTDTLIAKIPRNGRFLYSAFSRCAPRDVMDYFESIGVPLKVERGNRVFPVSDKAADIVEALKKALRDAEIPVIRARVKALCFENGRCTGAVTTDGTVYRAKTTLLATGGVSYPVTGSTGDGYRFAQEAGHTIIEPLPSLIPLETEEDWFAGAAGLTLKNVKLRILEKNKCRYEEQGELMLMAYGLSGPLTLSASASLKAPFAGKYTAEIDLKPALSVQQLDARLLREFTESPNSILGQILRKVLPAQLIDPVCSICGIPPDMSIHSVTKQQRSTLVSSMKRMTLHISGTRPIAEAIITRGGIPVKEIDAKTMASKKMPGLYFAGEIIDADGFTGGFNLQIAFSTAFSAGIAMAQEAAEIQSNLF